MKNFLGIFVVLAACGTAQETSGQDGGRLESCQEGDVQVLVRLIRDEEQCVDAYTTISVGCASADTPDDLLYYFECWEDRETEQRVVSPVPLENLRTKANWQRCPDQDGAQAWATTCQKDDCERHAATLCTFEITCEQLACGDGWSPYQANGCLRERGSACVLDEECDAPQVCSLFQQQGRSLCAYRPDGSCFCEKTGIGPTESGFCTAP